MRSSSIKIVVLAFISVFFLTCDKEIYAAAPKVGGFVKAGSVTGIGLPDVYVKWTGVNDSWRYEKTDANGEFNFYGWSEYHELTNTWVCSGGLGFLDQTSCENNGYDWYGSKCSDGDSVTPADCSATGGYWTSFVCSDGRSVIPSTCSFGGGRWYGENGVTADCDQFSSYDLTNRGGDRIIHNLESMLTVRPDRLNTSNKTFATCPPPSGPADCNGEPCVCPSNIPASPPDNCFAIDPGPPPTETFGFNFDDNGEFGCGTSHVFEPVLPWNWYGHFEPSSISYTFPGPGLNNAPDRLVAGTFIYIRAFCGDTNKDEPNDDGIMEQCDDGNTDPGDGCDSNCQTEGASFCSFDLTDVNLNGIGDIGQGMVTDPVEEPPGNRIEFVVFSIPIPMASQPFKVEFVGPAVDNTPPSFTADFRALVDSGQTSYSGVATMTDGTTCNASAPIFIGEADAWWQVKDADAITVNGDISSNISSSCMSPGCELITGDPAIPIASTLGSVVWGDGSGPSSSNWVVGGTAGSGYVGGRYDFNFFEDRFPSGVELTTNVDQDTFTDATTPSPFNCDPDGNYCYYSYNGAGLGDLTISAVGGLSLGERKIVILVTNADVNINSNIDFEDGLGMFMVVTDGNINIGPDATLIKGILVADDDVNTCVGCPEDNDSLTFYGTVVAWGKINLQRSLADNTTDPAEIFEFAPEQILLFPPALGKRNIRWSEVAP
jgi:cysteine-rich repeat protein